MTQTQELLSERESRRRLESEVETLCSQERELKGKTERLEAALYKVSDGLLVKQMFISIRQYRMFCITDIVNYNIKIYNVQMSDSFAECQEFIQKQEQELMRLKLQHALEIKVKMYTFTVVVIILYHLLVKFYYSLAVMLSPHVYVFG